MRNTSLSNRKCSAILAAGAGVAVCLTGGGAKAGFVSGSIKGTNGGQSVFAVGHNSLYACSKGAMWNLAYGSGTSNRINFSSQLGGGQLNGTAGAYAVAHNAGVAVNAAMGGFADLRRVPDNVADKFFAVKFGSLGGELRYGWLHVVSSNAGGSSIQIDRWGYENTGATCKTLSESVTTQKLGLSDGHTKVCWTNTNEDGIARYEVQAKDASGAWKAVDSSTPGEGHYAATVAGGSQCRLVVEKVDGATQQINF